MKQKIKNLLEKPEKTILILLTTLLSTMPVSVQAARLYNEAYYQNEWCGKWNGQTEYQLKDYTRVDCLTESYAVEFDFAKKWAEAVGQSLHYGMMTGKTPAIVLIIEKPNDFVYFERLKPLCQKYGTTLWYMKSPVFDETIKH